MFVLVLALGMATAATPSLAETLIIEGISSQDGSNELPTAGITKSRVNSGWGEPASKIAAVGEPPISRWDYGSFVVYFEYDHVIHSVRKR